MTVAAPPQRIALEALALSMLPVSLARLGLRGLRLPALLALLGSVVALVSVAAVVLSLARERGLQVALVLALSALPLLQLSLSSPTGAASALERCTGALDALGVPRATVSRMTRSLLVGPRAVPVVIVAATWSALLGAAHGEPTLAALAAAGPVGSVGLAWLLARRGVAPGPMRIVARRAIGAAAIAAAAAVASSSGLLDLRALLGALDLQPAAVTMLMLAGGLWLGGETLALDARSVVRTGRALVACGAQPMRLGLLVAAVAAAPLVLAAAIAATLALVALPAQALAVSAAAALPVAAVLLALIVQPDPGVQLDRALVVAAALAPLVGVAVEAPGAIPIVAAAMLLALLLTIAAALRWRLA